MEEVQGWATKAQNKVDIMEAEEEARAQRRSYKKLRFSSANSNCDLSNPTHQNIRKQFPNRILVYTGRTLIFDS
jgi:hypothetical protein